MKKPGYEETLNEIEAKQNQNFAADKVNEEESWCRNKSRNSVFKPFQTAEGVMEEAGEGEEGEGEGEGEDEEEEQNTEEGGSVEDSGAEEGGSAEEMCDSEE